MQASDIPDKFQVPFGVNAGVGFIRAIPLAPTGETGAASLDTGFPPDCFVDGGYPFGQDFNGVLLQSTGWDRWQSAGAAIPYDATFQGQIGGYPKGAIVESVTAPGWFYLSTTDDNVTNPDASGAGWRLFCPAPLYAVDVGTANALSITLTPPPPSFAALAGFQIVVKKSASANTTSATITINSVAGPSTVSILHGDNTALLAGELAASEPFTVVPDGSNCIMQSVANVGTALPANSVTNAKLATMPDQTVKGNISGGTATPVDVPIGSLGVVPVGTIVWFARSTPPTGYLECNQASLSTTTYAALFGVIGYVFGGSGASFILPNLRGLFVRGWDDGSGTDPGRVFGTVQLDAIKAHTHSVPFFTDNTPTTGPGHGGTTSASPATSGSTGGTETRPLNLALLPCIKY